MLRRLTIILLLAALAGCSRPTSLPPEIDAARAREEAAIQKRLAQTASMHGGRHHSRNRDGDWLDGELADFDRLAAIGWAVRSRAAGLCGKAVRPAIGAVLSSGNDLPESVRTAYRRHFAIHDESVVLAVAPGSPASRGGLAVGDVVLGATPGASLRSVALARHLETGLDGPVRLSIRRGSDRLELDILPEPACVSRLDLMRAPTINAFADGAAILFTPAMLGHLDDDDQLAVIVGHELAHNVLEHLSKQEENEKAGAMFGGLLNAITGANHLDGHWGEVGGRAFSQSFEAEADYVGLYFAAAAGFNVGEAPGVWRKMAVANPATILHASTHPTSPARFVLLEETVREIDRKRAKGLALRPESRGK